MVDPEPSTCQQSQSSFPPGRLESGNHCSGNCRMFLKKENHHNKVRLIFFFFLCLFLYFGLETPAVLPSGTKLFEYYNNN